MRASSPRSAATSSASPTLTCRRRGCSTTSAGVRRPSPGSTRPCRSSPSSAPDGSSPTPGRRAESPSASSGVLTKPRRTCALRSGSPKSLATGSCRGDLARAGARVGASRQSGGGRGTPPPLARGDRPRPALASAGGSGSPRGTPLAQRRWDPEGQSRGGGQLRRPPHDGCIQVDFGSVRRMSSVLPPSSSARSVPFIAATSSREIASPRPTPPAAADLDASAR